MSTAALAQAQPARVPPPQRAQLEQVQRMQLRNAVREQRAQHKAPVAAAPEPEALPPRHLSPQERRDLRQQLRELRNQDTPLPPPSE